MQNVLILNYFIIQNTSIIIVSMVINSYTVHKYKIFSQKLEQVWY